MPKINQISLLLEGFKYDTSLDLNIGYYQIKMSENVSNPCTTILTWVKYYYKYIQWEFQFTRHFTAENEWFIPSI